MTIITNTDYVLEALNLLLEQFKDKENIEDLLSSFIQQIQLGEDVTFDLYSERLLDTAIGAQLDVLGTIVGQDREWSNDEEYRIYIKARIAINRSNGKAEELINIFNLVWGSTYTYEVIDTGNASISIELRDSVPTSVANIVLDLAIDAKAGGVKIQIIWNPDPDSDQFILSTQSGAIDTDTARGFANVAQTQGGKLSGVI